MNALPKKKIILISIVIIFFGLIYFYKNILIQKKYTIAIIQCASNKSLDLLANSFIKRITQLLGENNTSIIYQNSEGSLTNAHAICHQLQLNKNINLFFTIGSSVSQALSIVEKERPIIITGVTDPYAYNLNQKNVCGTIDTIDENFILTMINNINPNAKKIGILRTAGDINEKEFIYFKQLCNKQNKEIKDFAVSYENEILSNMESICKEIDILLIPCDSLVVSVLPYITKITKKYKIPTFTCFIEGAYIGALGSTGINYEENGISAAETAKKIITNDINVGLLGFKKAKYEKIYYNKELCKLFKIHPENNKIHNFFYI